MKAKIFTTFLIALAAVLVAFIEWSIAEGLGVWRIPISIFTGLALAAILILWDLKSRGK
jgi:hypothetical protein